MSHPVVTARIDQSIASAADAMVLSGVGSVVVVHDDGSVAGILTERDLVRAAAAGADTRVAVTEHWMTAAPDVIEPSTSIDET
ncbi:MAG: CBS domain-containing protein, partial [Acidimicrobiales bacterium]|nr:CBS domain-containing protein [Acidimicrobiales bacterium]